MRKRKSINRPLLCLAFFKGFFFVKFIDLMIYSSTKKRTGSPNGIPKARQVEQNVASTPVAPMSSEFLPRDADIEISKDFRCFTHDCFSPFMELRSKQFRSIGGWFDRLFRDAGSSHFMAVRYAGLPLITFLMI